MGVCAWGGAGCTAAANGKVLPHSPSRSLNANQRISRPVTQAPDPITSTAAAFARLHNSAAVAL